MSKRDVYVLFVYLLYQNVELCIFNKMGEKHIFTSIVVVKIFIYFFIFVCVNAASNLHHHLCKHPQNDKDFNPFRYVFFYIHFFYEEGIQNLLKLLLK